MELLGIGPLELLFIFIIILLVAGPKDIAAIARNLGKGLNRLYKSSNYQVIRKASQEIRNLPARLAREAQIEELEELKLAQKDLQEAAKSLGDGAARPFQAWVQDIKPPNTPPGAGRAAQTETPRRHHPEADAAGPPAAPAPPAAALSADSNPDQGPAA